jgi:hypothetical protein
MRWDPDVMKRACRELGNKAAGTSGSEWLERGIISNIG